MKLSDDRYEKSKKENLKKNLENVTRDIANSWKEHTGSMDIFTSGLRRCGQAVLQHYQKKNVSYVVIDDTIFLNSNTERGPNPLNIKGIKPITLIDPGLFTIRFKIDEARIVSRFNLIKTGELKKYDLKIQTMEFGK